MRSSLMLFWLGPLTFTLLADPPAQTAEVRFAGEKKLNNVTSQLLDVAAIGGADNAFKFSRPAQAGSSCRPTAAATARS